MIVLHSGDMGDVVYSVPCARNLAARSEGCCQAIDAMVKAGFLREGNLLASKGLHWVFRPSVEGMGAFGGARFHRAAIQFLRPLFEAQGWTTEIWTPSTHFDVDLNLVRRSPVDIMFSTLANQYNLVFQCVTDLSSPWLEVEPIKNNYIICGRSTRLTRLDYSCLNQIYLRGLNVGFLGLPEEWEAFKQMVPGAVYLKVENALEGARLIAGSKGYIGNSSFWFAVAEALKVKRLLEVYPTCANVTPSGGICGNFVTQSGFEFLLRQFYP
jgi:hypothetical protein